MNVFQITMNERDIQVILEALAELPYKKSFKLIQDFHGVLMQALAQPVPAGTQAKAPDLPKEP